MDAYVLVRASLLLTAGAVGDRWGRRRLFRLGLVLFTAASLLCSLAPSVGVLVTFRIVQAVGGAVMTPATLAIIANTFPEPAERARAIGVWGATTGLSTAGGPVLGGMLIDAVGWRSVFWVNVPVGILALLATRVLPESRAATARRLDLPGQALIITALAALVAGLIAVPSAGWTAPRVLAPLLTAGVLGGLFVLVEHRRREPLLPLGYFRSPLLSGAVVTAVLSFLAMGGFLFYNTLYLQDVRGLSALQAGLVMVPTTAATVVLASLSGRISAVHGPRRPAAIAFGLLIAGMGVLTQVTTPTTPLGVLMGGYALFGGGLGLLNPPVTNAAVSGLPSAQAGVASATTSTARQIGTSLGVALLGSLILTHTGAGHGTIASAPHVYTIALTHGYLMITLLLTAGLLITLGAFRRGRCPQPTADTSTTP